MDHCCAQHLVIIGHRPVAVDFVQTRRPVNSLRGKIPGAIEGQEIVAIKKHQRFKRLAALQLPKDALAQWTQRGRGHRIEYLAHLRVTRDAFHAVETPQIALCPLFVKGE